MRSDWERGRPRPLCEDQLLSDGFPEALDGAVFEAARAEQDDGSGIGKIGFVVAPRLELRQRLGRGAELELDHIDGVWGLDHRVYAPFIRVRLGDDLTAGGLQCGEENGVVVRFALDV